jgi:mono/diheme cytochrome c family protein
LPTTPIIRTKAASSTGRTATPAAHTKTCTQTCAPRPYSMSENGEREACGMHMGDAECQQNSIHDSSHPCKAVTQLRVLGVGQPMSSVPRPAANVVAAPPQITRHSVARLKTLSCVRAAILASVQLTRHITPVQWLQVSGVCATCHGVCALRTAGTALRRTSALRRARLRTSVSRVLSAHRASSSVCKCASAKAATVFDTPRGYDKDVLSSK